MPSVPTSIAQNPEPPAEAAAAQPDASARPKGEPGLQSRTAILLKAALVGACLAYTLWDLDLRLFVDSCAAIPGERIALLTALSLCVYVTQGLRIRALTMHRAGTILSIKAGLLGQALNNIVPAKIGEYAKLVYLSRHTDLGLSRSMGAVLFEKFFDVNILALLFIAAGFLVNLPVGGATVALGLVGCWTVLLILRRYPALGNALIARLPFLRLRAFLSDSYAMLHQDISLRYLAEGLGLSLLHWGASIAVTMLAIGWMAGADLGPRALFVVYLVSAVGQALPTSPGSIGVFEASIVAAMALYGIGKETALVTGLIVHALFFVPQTLLGGFVFLRSDLTLRNLIKPGRSHERGPEED